MLTAEVWPIGLKTLGGKTELLPIMANETDPLPKNADRERSPRPSARETMERVIEQAAKFFSDTDLSEMTESQRASHEHSADIFTAAVASQRYADTRFGDLFFLAAMKILSDVPDLAGMVERLIKAGKLDAPVVTKIGRALTAAGSPIIQGESHAMATVARTGAAARRGASG